jgi:hypothetical protein
LFVVQLPVNTNNVFTNNPPVSLARFYILPKSVSAGATRPAGRKEELMTVKSTFKRSFMSGRTGTLLGLFISLAAHTFAAPGVSVVPAMTSSHPGGFLFDGSQMWVSDASQGLCRMDGGGGGGVSFTLTNCVKPSTNNPAVGAVVGQPAYDPATGFAYLPDSSSASKGIWRYTFSPGGGGGGGGTFNTPVNIAATAGLGGQRPGAISLGPDGNLYVSMAGNSSIRRVHTPAANAQTVDSMTTTLDGKPAGGLAIVGVQLWVAEGDGVLVIPDPVGCGTQCRGALNTQLIGGIGVSAGGFTPTLSISFDRLSGTLYLGTQTGIYRDKVNTGAVDFYSGSFVNNAGTGLFSNVTAVGFDNLGNAFLVDDPTAGQTAGGAALYMVPAGSLPDGLGGVPQPPITVPPTIITNELSSPGSQYVLGSQRTGALWLPGPTPGSGHIWVADAAAGFCKVDPALAAPSLTACAVLPAAFAAGSPAFDPRTNLVYIPDTAAGGAGIVKLTFIPQTETVGGVSNVVTANNLAKAAGAGATAPTAVTLGPDRELYSAMGGTNVILRISSPSTNAPVTKFIGFMNDVASPSVAFNHSDLWDAEKQNASILYNATLCKGTCQAQFFAVILRLASAVVSDGTYMYVGDSHLAGTAPGDRLWRYDPAADVFQILTTSKIMNGALAPLNTVSGIAVDPAGNIYAADADGIWQVSTGAPTVSSLAPFQAAEGSTQQVTINGTGFSGNIVVSTCPAIAVSNVVMVSSTQLTAQFDINPLGPLGPCAVTVTTAAGAASGSFKVLVGPPALGAITPATGARGTTVPVSITGANLTGGTINAIPGITFNNVQVVNDGQITASFVIPGTTALGPVSVVVSTPSGNSNALSFAVTALPPSLTGISPTTATANSTIPLSLTGTNLADTTLNLPAGFTLSGVPTIGATSITASVVIASTVAAGPYSISVTTPGGTSNAEVITILPKLTSIAPTSAPAGTSTPVTISGLSLAGVTTLNVGVNITLTGVTTITATSITATFTTAASAPNGPQTITVTDANGTSNGVTFTITAPVPALTSISPATGGTGATVPVVIQGTGLVGATLNLPAGLSLSGAPTTSFSQINASILIAANASLGNKSITATTAGGTSNAVTFNVFALAPLITTITPTSAAAGSSPAIIINGRGFSPDTTIQFNGAGITVTSFTVVSATGISANLSVAANAVTQGLSVTNLNGTSNTVTFGVTPTLNSISPNSLPASLSTTVTLTGTSLVGATAITPGAGITVTNLTVVSATQVTATFTIAAGATVGTRNVTITTPGGISNAVVFNVLQKPPVITAINPSPMKRGSNQGVTITGTTFTGANNIGAVALLLNGAPVTLPTVTGFTSTATQIKYNWNLPTTLAASDATHVYTMTVTTGSGTSNAFPVTLQ